jgi:histidine decarboxylase
MSRFKLKNFNLKDVINGAVTEFGPYCMGYLNPGGSGNGYISTMKLAVDKVSLTGLDAGTEGIVAYDRCEKDGAYIGQINMLTASSFCGVNGALWGYHLAKADTIASGTLKPMFTYLDTTERLFGRMDKTGSSQKDRRRFPPMPGAHVICANKDASAKGPGYIWSALAIAIADNRNLAANLFIEDANFIPAEVVNIKGKPTAMPSHKQVEDYLRQTLRAIAKSMILCGQDQDVTYKEIFAGAKFLYVSPDEWGCALTCAPYIQLAHDAVPGGAAASGMIDLNISQWEKKLKLKPLPKTKKSKEGGSVGC